MVNFNLQEASILKRIFVISVCIFLLTALTKNAGADEMVQLYDTLKPIEAGTETSALESRTSWRLLSEADTGKAIEGDAVIINIKMMATLVRKNGCTLYMKSPKGWTPRAEVQAVANRTQKNFAGLSVASDENGCGVKAHLEGIDGAALLISVGTLGFPAIKINRVGGVEALRYIAPSRLGVLPGIYSDDIMIDAQKIPVDLVKIPNDHIFLQFTAEGSTIVAAIWNEGDENPKVAFEGKGESRKIKYAEVPFPKKGALYASIIESSGVWHSQHMSEEEVLKGGAITKWVVPYSAQWRGDFTLKDGSTVSRQFLSETAQKERPDLQWIDKLKENDGKGKGTYKAILEPLNTMRFPKGIYETPEGLVAFYPLNRASQTPLVRFTVVDLIRLTREYWISCILDIGDDSEYGAYLISAYHTLLPTITPSEYSRASRGVAEKIKAERVYLRHINTKTSLFIKQTQNKINDYVDFRVNLLKYFEEHEKNHPKAQNLITRVKKLIHYKRSALSKAETTLQKDRGVQRAGLLFNQIEKAFRTETPAQVFRGIAISDKIKSLGDLQDKRIHADRMIVRRILSIVSTEMVLNPDAFEMAKEIRKRSLKLLRDGTNRLRPV